MRCMKHAPPVSQRLEGCGCALEVSTGLECLTSGHRDVGHDQLQTRERQPIDVSPSTGVLQCGSGSAGLFKLDEGFRFSLNGLQPGHRRFGLFGSR